MTVSYCNTERPRQALDFDTPAVRFEQRPEGARGPAPTVHEPEADPPDRTGDGWVTRKVSVNGVVCVDWQKVSVGKHRAGQHCDVLVTDQLLQFWIGPDLLKTAIRTGHGEVRKKNAEGTGRRA